MYFSKLRNLPDKYFLQLPIDQYYMDNNMTKPNLDS